MKKVQNFSAVNLIFALVIFIIGIVLITSPTSIINILSWIIGGVLELIGLIKIISYVRHKNLNVDAGTLIMGVLMMALGAVIMIFPNIIDVTIRIIFGGWILFTGINRLILAFAIGKIDKTGFKTFLITSIVMVVVGIVILISFYRLLGALLVIYAISEIVDYIYFNSNKQKYSTIFDVEEKAETGTKVKKIKQEIKDKEAIEAVIDQ